MFLIFFSTFIYAAEVSSPPFPVFLKTGFSSVIEFEEKPTRIVLGDPNSFQVERLGNSIAVRPLTDYAVSNLFVYFMSTPKKILLLKASEDVEPTFYKKFETIMPKVLKVDKPQSTVRKRELKILSTQFDIKKDYLIVEVALSADRQGKIFPKWEGVRMQSGSSYITPSKLWSERKEVQRDAMTKARFIFIKPNVSKDLKNVSLIVPVKGESNPFVVKLRGNN
jgi:hypothetical protein